MVHPSKKTLTTCLVVPNEFRTSSCKKESRQSISLGIEIEKIGWERGMLQCRSPFQDRDILLHLTRNSLHSVNPEFELMVDSLVGYAGRHLFLAL